jgi:hypothetical protein
MKAVRLSIYSPILILSCLAAGNPLSGDVTWFGPSESSNSSASMATGSASYTTNFGVAFKTGSTDNLSMDWVKLDLGTASITSGSASFTLALRNTTNSTAYSAAAGSTEYAADTINFSMPTTSQTYFTLNLTAADLPNITAYELSANTSYSLILYNASAAFAIQRHTGYGQNTTNNYYTVNDGFTALNTFRNNNTYTNSTNSYPTLYISFGETGTIPEPSGVAYAGAFALMACGVGLVRRGKR